MTWLNLGIHTAAKTEKRVHAEVLIYVQSAAFICPLIPSSVFHKQKEFLTEILLFETRFNGTHLSTVLSVHFEWHVECSALEM